MSDTLLIVHGYSDGSTSFTALRDFFVGQGLYDRNKVFFVDYSSMDDQATFRDFASKLDADYQAQFAGKRIDVACHSTGSLVVRTWLALHLERARLREVSQQCPVHRLLCFAPANFGSDLATLGQSFLGKFRSTFFNSNSHRGDFMESGKEVLRGLEPASPFQWELSGYDLHGAYTYFNPKVREEDRCYPFVFAASTGYTGLEAKLVPKRAMPGTDGTVRIAGTSLNTRLCTLDFLESGADLSWRDETKFSHIPFCVQGLQSWQHHQSRGGGLPWARWSRHARDKGAWRPEPCRLRSDSRGLREDIPDELRSDAGRRSRILPAVLLSRP